LEILSSYWKFFHLTGNFFLTRNLSPSWIFFQTSRSGNSGRERVGEAARGGINSFVGSIWHLEGAAEAVWEQQKRE
jgi:hypothetical protein